MKNLKEIVASFAAVAMVMSIGSVAFADGVTGSISVGEDHDTVSLTNYASIVDSSNQWTVIIIHKDKQLSETLTGEDLYYINQGTSADGFWTNMGTKSVLADGDYLMRIGGTSLPNYEEIEFTVSSTPEGIEIQLGDTNDDGTVDISDVNPVIQHILKAVTLTGKAAKAADTNSDDTIDISDVNPIIQHILKASTLGTALYVAE